MFSSALEVFATIFSWAFVVGAAGCAFVIPIVAYRLFSSLFESDANGDE